MSTLVTSAAPSVSNIPTDDLQRLFDLQRQHQYVVRRSTAKMRRKKLQQLHTAILSRQARIEAALWSDLRKSTAEVAISELGVALGELRVAIRHLNEWMAPRSVSTPLALFGSSSEIIYEPKGVCLIMAPWNYPVNLSFAPLASAIAAGNCVILKPSEHAPASSALIREIVEACFAPEEVAVVEGDVSVGQALLELPFNHIFFTGSPAVGKIVMAAASRHLTSVTLELGGKSPVIVDKAADVALAAEKVAFLKGLNAAQTCIAPDYVWVHTSRYEAFVEGLKASFQRFYGPDPAASPDYCRLIHDRHFQRLKSLLDDAVARGADVLTGGQTDASDRYMAPTVLANVPEDATLWEEEIFGPILPLRVYSDLDEPLQYINARPQPLALYIFSNHSGTVNHILQETRSGGVTVNDCGPHFYNHELPFGGVNHSGIGKSHGYAGFLEYTNQRGVLRQTRIFPTTHLMRPPFGGALQRFILKAIVRWF